MTTTNFSRYSSIFCRIGALLALALAVATHSARADDIDTYSAASAATGKSNVLFIVDNSANWSTKLNVQTDCGIKLPNGQNLLAPDEEGKKMGAEKCALYRIFSTMKLAELQQFYFGFMLFNESPTGSAYPRLAFMTVDTEADRTKILTMIAGLGINAPAEKPPGDKGNNAATAEALYEAWLWFTGSKVYLGDKTYYKNGTPKFDTAAFTGGPGNRTYVPPGIGCARNHIIYLANGKVQDQNNTVKPLLERINPSYKQIAIPVAEGVSKPDADNWTDEFAAFFYRGADLSTTYEGQQNIQVNTIAVTGAEGNRDYVNFMRWIAEMGGGMYEEANDVSTIIAAVTDMLNQIRASNSVFSSAALPVSANTQGAYLNQVFIGMFRPDGNALQRWVGNLKQYQFSYDGNTLQLADVNGKAAVSSTTGFITSTATSFWTQPSSFWINAETASSTYNRSDAPDGELVEKGGIAQWLRTTYPTLASRANRPVYTCVTDCGIVGGVGSVVDLSTAGGNYLFNTSNSQLNFGLFNVGSAVQMNLLIDWIRGDENVAIGNVADYTAAKDQLTTPPAKDLTLTPPISDANSVRPSIHGDVLHSRPVALNYGGSQGVVVFYGANDGMLRAINGNQDPKKDSAAGSELWAFVAPEHYASLNRLRENRPEVLYPSTPASNLTARRRDYFFDGPIGAYQNTATNEVMIFPTMRRGGSSVYAFDVSNPKTPKLMWRINTNASGFSGLGQTWSTPRVAPVKWNSGTGTADPVLIMGGGYDNQTEDSSPLQSNGGRGRGVYVINIRTGELLAWLPTDFSVPSDVSLIDTDGDGYVDRAYLVDVRAQLYRIDIEPSTGAAVHPGKWTITKLAALNDDKDGSGAGGLDSTRKVFFGPDVVLTRKYVALMLGTGDREKPLTMTTNDRFYVVKDRKVTKGAPTSVTLLTDASSTLVPVSDTAAKDDPDGCYLAMAQNGEKVINQPVTFGGVTYFSSNAPTPNVANKCSATQSKAYQVPLICRAATFTPLVGDGLPPSPVVGYVDVDGKGKVVPFVIGGPNSKNSAIEVGKPPIKIPGNRKRSYWFMQNSDR